MILFILTLLIIASSLAPQLWVKYTLKKYGKTLPNMPGTGAELARHLINRFELQGTQLEKTTEGNDHFDPSTNTVRLSPSIFDGKSLTAIAVSTHEVGHAIQHNRNERIAQLRKKYIPLSVMLQKLGVLILILLPIITGVLKSPVIFGLAIGLSLLLQIAAALTYLIILPEEWDASFNKALPILQQGEYVPEHYQPAIRKVLKAAALTYFAAALANVLNIGRWFMILRR
ncbi:MAG TPA: zinc metallopeptidase [Marinagarivorans sp.]